MQAEESTSLCDVKYKIVFLGQMAVGKSSIIQRFIRGDFDQRHMQTVGIDFLVKNITYNNHTYRMQLWDTAGQQKFRSLIPAYLRDANCVVFVYDITRKQSYSNLKHWFDLYNENQPYDAISILVANKIDLRQDQKISEEKAKSFAQSKSISYCQVSAKTGEGVTELFQSIIQNINISKKQTISRMSTTNTLDANSSTAARINKKPYLRINNPQNRLACCYI